MQRPCCCCHCVMGFFAVVSMMLLQLLLLYSPIAIAIVQFPVSVATPRRARSIAGSASTTTLLWFDVSSNNSEPVPPLSPVAGTCPTTEPAVEQQKIQSPSPNSNNNKTTSYSYNVNWLEDATRTVLDLDEYPYGSLNADDIAEMTDLMTTWPRRRSTAAALTVERLLKRIVDELPYHNAGSGDAVVKVTTQMYTAAISAWGKSGAPGAADRALDIHSGMVQLYQRTGNIDILPDINSYNALLNAIRHESNAKMAEQVLSEMMQTDSSVAPDEQSVRIVLETYARSFQRVGSSPEGASNVKAAVARCEAIFASLFETSTTTAAVSALTFGALQNVYARCGLPNAVSLAETVLRNMTSAAAGTCTGDTLMYAKPTTANYNAVLHALSRSKRVRESVQKAESILMQMELPVEQGGLDVEPDRLSYAVAVLVCSRCRNCEAAERVLEQMEARALKEAHIRREISSAAPAQVTLDVESFNVVLQAISHSRSPKSVDRVLRIIDRMETYTLNGQGAVRPNIRSWNAVLNTYARASSKNNTLFARDAANLLERITAMHRAGDPNVKPNAFTFVGVLSAYLRSEAPEAARQADDLVRRMESLYELGEIDAPPDTYHYTILCGTWARSYHKIAPERVLQILVHMMEREKAGYPNVKPNTRTYNSVLDCLAKNGDANRAEELLFHMVNLYKNGDETSKPDLFSFNCAIRAFCRSKQKDAGLRAENVLDRMYELQEEGILSVRPDARSYKLVLAFYGRCREPDAPYRAEYLLNRMISQFKDGQAEPQLSIFAITTVMDSYAHAAHPDAGRNASRLLDLIRKLKENHGASKLVVNTPVMNSVLFAWSSCGDENAGNRAEHYLDEMEASYGNGVTQLQPDTRSYGLVLSTWSKSRCPDKYRRSLRILRRMEEQQAKGNRQVEVDEHVRSLVINTCGFSNAGREVESEAFAVAVSVFDEMLESSETNPLTSLSFGWFIQACGRLRVPDEEANAQIARAFKICCDTGHVNDFVVHRLKGAVSDTIYHKLMQSTALPTSGMPESPPQIPADWKRNAKQWQRKGR